MKIIDFIYSNINIFSKDKNKIIVGIEGASGIGKTTITKLLEEKSKKIEILHTDNFQLDINQKIFTFKNLNKKSEIYKKGWFDSKKIQQKIEFFKKDPFKKILIIDGIFLLNKEIFGDNINKIIYIKMDEKIFKKRRIDRIKKNKEINRDKNYLLFSELLDVAWNNYIKEYNLENKADIVININ